MVGIYIVYSGIIVVVGSCLNDVNIARKQGQYINVFIVVVYYSIITQW